MRTRKFNTACRKPPHLGGDDSIQFQLSPLLTIHANSLNISCSESKQHTIRRSQLILYS